MVQIKSVLCVLQVHDREGRITPRRGAGRCLVVYCKRCNRRMRDGMCYNTGVPNVLLLALLGVAIFFAAFFFDIFVVFLMIRVLPILDSIVHFFLS